MKGCAYHVRSQSLILTEDRFFHFEIPLSNTFDCSIGAFECSIEVMVIFSLKVTLSEEPMPATANCYPLLPNVTHCYLLLPQYHFQMLPSVVHYHLLLPNITHCCFTNCYLLLPAASHVADSYS